MRGGLGWIISYFMSDDGDYGPAMAALTERQRQFVLAMAADPFGNASKWARTAGYSTVKGGNRVQGHLLMHNAKIQEAVLEVGRGLLAGAGPILAAHAILRAARTPRGKGHMQAVQMLANRVGMAEVQQVHVRHTDQTGAAMVERIKALALKHGIDPGRLLGGVLSGSEAVNPGSSKVLEVIDAEPVKRRVLLSQGGTADAAGGEGAADDGGAQR